MKRSILTALILFAFYSSFAGHIAGGEIYYERLGPGSATNTDKYRITLRLFRECVPPPSGNPNQMIAQLPTDVIIGIYNSPGTFYQEVFVVRTKVDELEIKQANPCIVNAPQVCYQVGYYSFEKELPITAAGYVVSFQTCCRTNGIANISGSSVGATYTAEIPGTNITGAERNSSAVFSLKDTTLVCKSSNFIIDFGATDPDGDSLSYSFCAAYNGGPTVNSAPVRPSNPPYGNISYSGNYSGSQPLGPNVTINNKTGIISGTAPDFGSYVVNVCVAEFRQGKLVTVHRKDFTLKIGNCELSAAKLKPSYTTCDGFTMTFSNESTSALISTYRWEFGDPFSGANNVSNAPQPVHTYTDTGIFNLKLRVENNVGCKDSTNALVRVYPGFSGDFDVKGSCFETPFVFTDKTVSKYGVVDSWRWDFGDPDSNADVSDKQHPTYKYPVPAARTAQLIVTNSKGCADTVIKTVQVRDVPLLNLPFKDTLVCSIDTLQLRAEGTGVFSWSPANIMVNPNSANPLVYPKDTTTYVVTLNENGCTSKDSITVNVLDFITVDIGKDTSICLTDSVTMSTASHALQYSWTPTTGMNNPALKNPTISPAANTRYYVTANLGKCQDNDSILIRVAPYPQATAGGDVSICYGTRTQLTGNIVGGAFSWSPSGTLTNANTLTPSAGPLSTTSYVLTAFNSPTSGCPKPFRDTVVVNVVPRVMAFAGNDTNIVANQPLQLHATGGSIYTWSPATGLSTTNGPDPIAILGASTESITYRVRVATPEGCFATDDITVKVFKTGPEIFVPSAFTPNADGKNDVLRPLVVGMRSMTFFRVYNRWGQLLYSTSEPGKGWDGKVGGKDQASGTYVYSAEAFDYNGNKVSTKGSVVLIR